MTRNLVKGKTYRLMLVEGQPTAKYVGHWNDRYHFSYIPYTPFKWINSLDGIVDVDG